MTARTYTPDEAADKLLGWTDKDGGRRLIRRILKREKKTGKQIATRYNHREHTVGYLVTEHELREELPELFSDFQGLTKAKGEELVCETRKNLHRLVKEEIKEELEKLIANEMANFDNRLARLEVLVTKNTPWSKIV